MAEYSVTWTIEIDADSPLDAAKMANEILQESGNDAVVFTVVNENGEGVIVDLMEPDGKPKFDTSHAAP